MPGPYANGGLDGRPEAVFLDVDGTLLWVDLDVEGYVSDLSPYARNGELTVERANEPVRESMRDHIKENIKYRTEEELAAFKRRNAANVARKLGIEAPDEVLSEVANHRISFNPYPESERVMKQLRRMNLRLYVVSNWDILLPQVLDDLGWLGYFEGIVVSAQVGTEKPEAAIFEEALRMSGLTARPEQAIHIGNDPVADVKGAASAGIRAVLIDRVGEGSAPEAAAVLEDLSGLPALLNGERL